MSREVISAVIRGAHGYVSEAEEKLAQLKKEKGSDFEIKFPETAFYLPMAYSLMGIEAKTVKDLETIVAHCKELLPEVPALHQRRGDRRQRAVTRKRSPQHIVRSRQNIDSRHVDQHERAHGEAERDHRRVDRRRLRPVAQQPERLLQIRPRQRISRHG